MTRESVFRAYYKLLGGHVHVRVFIGVGKAGDLCMSPDEFELFKLMSKSFIDYHEEE